LILLSATTLRCLARSSMIGPVRSSTSAGAPSRKFCFSTAASPYVTEILCPVSRSNCTNSSGVAGCMPTVLSTLMSAASAPPHPVRRSARAGTSLFMPAPLPKRGDDVLGEHLDLPHLLVPGHEPLVEEPAEPLEVAVAADRPQRLHLPLDVVRPPRQRVLDLPHPLDRPFRRWQGRVRIERILRPVLRPPRALPEAQTRGSISGPRRSWCRAAAPPPRARCGRSAPRGRHPRSRPDRAYVRSPPPRLGRRGTVAGSPAGAPPRSTARCSTWRCNGWS